MHFIGLMLVFLIIKTVFSKDSNVTGYLESAHTRTLHQHPRESAMIIRPRGYSEIKDQGKSQKQPSLGLSFPICHRKGEVFPTVIGKVEREINEY